MISFRCDSPAVRPGSTNIMEKSVVAMWQDSLSVLGLLAVVPLLLVALTLWMRHHALRSAAIDPEAAWFSYARFMKLGTQAAWLVSLGLLSLPLVETWVDAVAGPQPKGAAIGTQAFIWVLIALLPMSVATIVCRTLSYPVFAQVHGSLWTRGEIFRQAFWTQAAFTIPALCLVAAFSAMRDENWRAAVFLALLGFAALFFGVRQVAAASGRTSESLSTGELRDRVFQLAAKAGVTLKSLYVISSAKSRTANAFAARGNIVMVTDYLLTRLTRREVDAIVAHELTHLKRQHIALRAVMFAAVFYISFGIALGWFHMRQIPLLVAVALLIFFLIARINERSADAGAVKITEDPEAMITGLVKATRLNKFPLRWSKLSEWLMTHPSTMRRAEAIARNAGIAPERLAEILQQGTSGDDHYTLPPAIASKVFSTKYKRSQAAKRSWTFLAIMTATPAAILGIANAAGLDGVTFLAAWVLSLVATFALYLVAMNYLSLSGNGPLEKQLRAKLKSENVIAHEDGGTFVSLAPDGVARLYDGSFSWDMGVLYVGAEKIVYVGEEARFALRRQEITEIQTVRGSPAWIPTRAVLIRWNDPSRNRTGALMLRPQAMRTLGQQSDAAGELAERLEKWLDGWQSATDESPAEEFGTPVIGAVTSISPAQLARGRAATRSLRITGYIAAAAAVLCNLSFTWPLDGWFAVLATMILAVVQFVPYWRYREGARSTENA
jgi:Zn-dependent protease with chaperone function